MSKSTVKVFCGGRGSGKTLSMSVEAVLYMIAGKKVWSNYPIKFAYRNRKGNINHYKSTVIDMPDLVEIQSRDEIRDGLVCLDEWNLFCNARRSAALSNIIFSGIVQLIRKRKLSFLITTQDFMTLDKNIRWQCDVIIECFDLSFRYKNLREGQFISQYATDWSGVFTGRPLTKWDDMEARMRNTRTRILNKANNFFGCYNTDTEFNVLDIMSRKIKLNRNDGTVQDSGGFDVGLLDEYKDSLLNMGTTRITADELQSALNDMGIKGSLHGTVGRKLKQVGFKYKQMKHQNVYELVESN